MSTIRAFSREMLENACRSNGWNPSLHDDGNGLTITFVFDDESKRNIVMGLECEGEKKQIMKIIVFCRERFRKSEWGRVILACNKWNATTRWPKASLDCQDPNEEGVLLCDFYLDCEKDIHQEFVDFQVWQIYGSAMQFFRWAYKEEKLWT